MKEYAVGRQVIAIITKSYESRYCIDEAVGVG